MYLSILLMPAAGIAWAQAPVFCSGYDPERLSWGSLFVEQAGEEASCPAGWAVLSLGYIPRGGDVSGTCCPLPQGALLDRHQFARQSCPPGFVVTGLKAAMAAAGSWQARGFEYWLRCSEINQAAYSVSPAEMLHVIPAQGFTYYRTNPTTSRSKLPPELRYGLGRSGRTTWIDSFCVGYPWGSILSGYGSRGCTGSRFLELKAKEAQAPEMPCKAVQDIVSTGARCITDNDLQFTAAEATERTHQTPPLLPSRDR